jgi:hypothetical protein
MLAAAGTTPDMRLTAARLSSSAWGTILPEPGLRTRHAYMRLAATATTSAAAPSRHAALTPPGHLPAAVHPREVPARCQPIQPPGKEGPAAARPATRQQITANQN